MFDDTFGNAAQTVSGNAFVSGRSRGRELPFHFAVKGAQINAALKKESGVFRQQFEGVLKSVVNLSEQSGTQFHREQFSGEFNFITDFETVGAFKDLQIGDISADTDDFTFEPGISHDGIRHFVLHDPAGVPDSDKVAVDADNLFSDCVVFCHDVL